MFSTSVDVKYFYDDGSGTPVDITAIVLNNPKILFEGMTEETTPAGVVGDKFTPTGRSKSEPIEVSGVFKTGDANDADDLFGDRVPEAPDAATRTFAIEYTSTGRRRSVETYLTKYDIESNKDNGLTRFTAKLRPTGDVTETIPA